MKISNVSPALEAIDNDCSISAKIVCLTGDEHASVFAIELHPGQFIPVHYHTKGIEMYYILSGEGLILVRDIQDARPTWKHILRVSSGDCFSIYPGQVHKFENNSAQNVQLLVTAPMSHTNDEDRFFVVESDS
ncbi:MULTISPECIES: cupin domain-containing protein [Chryseobacterium]|uniref:Mannose-6-phosphate isomerase-like protein (Cupin superfamily) n=1 Tax=Chryseobacterium camelliae TaxID=1265445 RepID=A0ABU0TKS8_9FLAO|nr:MULTISPECIES: cupin domain-containing protein [Chryseobacterium]MDT3408534.1 mannose-6-phosphate isomerase-like protein (cupin superfamily) [Pseudacidovorax intermedius]MDQ1097611.1 mannose-6-phosphate isomerase-like protein (cupin superfamily) [Chryseobacterium camelliae]MDQ1101540.1 mannose-6-phosphate isomerase-like protein (cupin superfamily) [Chryseobacterium sp. SORGH_AS_1048]MDR6084983.1 mannose-6-phosphate isomerase-like protein (cupin superfamily) [Chryseobacterium sp. SORGH_AS_0909